MNLSNWLRASRAVPGCVSKKRRHRLSANVEMLEHRVVPSTFWVSNRHDSGSGSLRQAVLDANGHSGADTIAFRNTAEGTITLTSGELSVTGDVRIDGPGSDRLIVSGGNTSRVLEIASGAKVTVDDVKITNGLVLDSNGGAILNAGTLALSDSVVSGSSAARSAGGTIGGEGGGIENTGILTIDDSKVSGNSALAGGGIHTAGTGSLTVKDSKVSNNLCVGDGAGIRNETGTTLNVVDSTITGNTASGFGTGGIATGAATTIRDTTLSENLSAVGGIYLFGGSDVVISDTRIVRNGPSPTSGTGAGGIWSSNSGHLTIKDTVIADNGGVGVLGRRDFFNNAVGTIDLADSTIRNNTGGGVFTFEAMTIERSTINDNTVGGGIQSQNSLTVSDSTISGNSGDPTDPFSVGGIAGFYGGINITRSTISGNVGSYAGGVAGYTGSITDSTISDNVSIPVGSVGGGGVVAVALTLDNSTVSGNTVIAGGLNKGPYDYYLGAAGGVLAVGPGTAIDHTTIAFNRAINAAALPGQVSGGVTGLDFDAFGQTFIADVSVRNTIIAKNTAAGNDPDVTGSFASQGHNLVGVLTGTATGFVASDLHGTTAAPLDPRLEPLKFNGGPTKTHALRHGSPAANAGDNANAPPTDQRGFDRIVGGAIDIGAYESGDSGGGHNNRPGVLGSNGGFDDPLSAIAAGSSATMNPVLARSNVDIQLPPSPRGLRQWLGIDQGVPLFKPDQPIDLNVGDLSALAQSGESSPDDGSEMS
jgi:hypothetical protein